MLSTGTLARGLKIQMSTLAIWFESHAMPCCVMPCHAMPRCAMQWLEETEHRELWLQDVECMAGEGAYTPSVQGCDALLQDLAAIRDSHNAFQAFEAQQERGGRRTALSRRCLSAGAVSALHGSVLTRADAWYEAVFKEQQRMRSKLELRGGGEGEGDAADDANATHSMGAYGRALLNCVERIVKLVGKEAKALLSPGINEGYAEVRLAAHAMGA